MLVTLAYAHHGNDPDTTIDVDPVEAKRLIVGGVARAATDVLGDMTIADLRSYAAGHDIDLTGASVKAEILAAIEAAEQTRATEPDPGDTQEAIHG